jgi:hypothetical protein
MPLQDILSYASFGIGIFGIIIAIYQGFERKKLKHYVRSQAWHVYSMANISSASIRAALGTYKEANKDNIDVLVFEHLSKSDAYNMSLFLETIRQIQLSEPEFGIQSIMQWQMQGKIPKDHAGLFFRLASMDTPGMCVMAWQSITMKIKSKLVKLMQVPQTPEASQTNTKPE